MPEKATLERARKKARQGKSASTQAGEFVREEIHHIREGKHGARSAKQAIAIRHTHPRRARRPHCGRCAMNRRRLSATQRLRGKHTRAR